MEDNLKVVEIRNTDENIETGANRASAPVFVAPAQKTREISSMAKFIRQTLIWFNIFTASICALIMVVNILLDGTLGDVLGKSFSIFLVLGGFSLFISILAPLLEDNK